MRGSVLVAATLGGSVEGVESVGALEMKVAGAVAGFHLNIVRRTTVTRGTA